MTVDDVAGLLLDVNRRLREGRRNAWPLAEDAPTTFLAGAELAAVVAESTGEDLLAAGHVAVGVRLLLRAQATRGAVDMLRRTWRRDGRV